jgi:hypothetical protein
MLFEEFVVMRLLVSLKLRKVAATDGNDCSED